MKKNNRDQLPPVSKELRQRARELRASMTEAERRLWRRIRSRRLGAYFHRQRILGRYICDFVTLESSLVIELDGSQHYTDEKSAKDKVRDEYMKSLGFKVLRFSNRDVMNNMAGVLEIIRDSLDVTPPAK